MIKKKKKQNIKETEFSIEDVFNRTKNNEKSKIKKKVTFNDNVEVKQIQKREKKVEEKYED